MGDLPSFYVPDEDYKAFSQWERTSRPTAVGCKQCGQVWRSGGGVTAGTECCETVFVPVAIYVPKSRRNDLDTPWLGGYGPEAIQRHLQRMNS